eukprot:NODE_1942_length_718_cov_216.312407_g1515_i2.p1 GENE.NODE_1942_length_718_cov_216.312407_g1515_i2~~NODE_1942_length_718_cov_216.312407_g1515_i2.p1  ORF type:complete len:161 (-),score=25.25 NODE_1942_length_718_cov_216.312407_g1515_i2:236-694(-)
MGTRLRDATMAEITRPMNMSGQTPGPLFGHSPNRWDRWDGDCGLTEENCFEQWWHEECVNFEHLHRNAKMTQGRAYESQYEQEIINYFRQKEVAKKRSSISPVASKPMDDLLKRRKMLVALRSPPAPPNDPPTSPPGDAIGMFTMELDAAAA